MIATHKRATAIASRKQELSLLRNFRCAEVHCLMPKDRAFVLAEVRRLWGSLDAFDTFVQQELPVVLRASKERYTQNGLVGTAYQAQDLFLGL